MNWNQSHERRKKHASTSKIHPSIFVWQSNKRSIDDKTSYKSPILVVNQQYPHCGPFHALSLYSDIPTSSIMASYDIFNSAFSPYFQVLISHLPLEFPHFFDCLPFSFISASHSPSNLLNVFMSFYCEGKNSIIEMLLLVDLGLGCSFKIKQFSTSCAHGHVLLSMQYVGADGFFS